MNCEPFFPGPEQEVESLLFKMLLQFVFVSNTAWNRVCPSESEIVSIRSVPSPGPKREFKDDF